MKHKRATHYGGRTPLGCWIESAFIALIALAFIAALLAMVAYAHGQPVSSSSVLADAFCATRLGGDWGHAFGTLPHGLDMRVLLCWS
jgi:hypothetical protein